MGQSERCEAAKRSLISYLLTLNVGNVLCSFLKSFSPYVGMLYLRAELRGGGNLCGRHGWQIPLAEQTTLKVDSHKACRSHAAPMPFPCHAVPLRV
jgi:hypothetical protein